jgi:diadenosine tetraphosphate (Ap4A) HIT family hydrolase
MPETRTCAAAGPPATGMAGTTDHAGTTGRPPGHQPRPPQRQDNMTRHSMVEQNGTPRHERVCLFCRVDDESVNSILDQSDNFYVRYDNFPATKGHVEIVPKRHIASFFELSSEEICEAYSLMRQTQQYLDSEYAPNGYTIGVNEGRAAGRTVDHLHIHLIPRDLGDVPDPRGGIRQALPNYDPDLWASAD